MQKAALRIGDMVGYTTDHPRSNYRDVEAQAMVVAFRDDRQGIGLAICYPGQRWLPRWVSGQYVLRFWDDYVAEKEARRQEREASKAKERARKEHLKALKQRFVDHGLKVERLDHSCNQDSYTLQLPTSELEHLLGILGTWQDTWQVDSSLKE